MTERERFEKWWNGPRETPQTKDSAWESWQAALNGGELTAKIFIVDGKIEGSTIDEPLPTGTYYLYTSPPNTYTEAEVDEMMMKVAKLTYGTTVTEQEVDLRAIVDKVKAGK